MAFTQKSEAGSIPDDLLGDDGVERVVIIRGVLVHGGVQVERGRNTCQDVVGPLQDLRVLVPATT